MAPDKILIVDDELDASENCRRILIRHHYECLVEADSNRALATIERERPKVLLTDLRMPGLDGIGLLKAAKRIDPNIRVVLLTAYASVQTAVASMRQGAFDYLAKPFTGEELRTVVRRALGEEDEDSDTLEESSFPRAESAALGQQGALIGTSLAIRMVREVIERLAATEAAVLISGESGTGKEFVARTIHARSARCLKPFLPVDCMASDEAALERQLFGADQAAPGSSAGSHPGLLELAHGGSLFLDEVDGLSSRLQAKVSRALKERRGRRVGASRFFDIDARVLAASTQDLQRLCSSGEFREDFYWLLNVVPMVLCPLRERVEDVEALAQWFLQTFLSHKHDRQYLPSGFTPGARRLLLRYCWPGNVRELRNVIERAAVFSDGSLIDLVHLPDRLASS